MIVKISVWFEYTSRLRAHSHQARAASYRRYRISLAARLDGNEMKQESLAMPLTTYYLV